MRFPGDLLHQVNHPQNIIIKKSVCIKERWQWKCLCQLATKAVSLDCDYEVACQIKILPKKTSPNWVTDHSNWDTTLENTTYLSKNAPNQGSTALVFAMSTVAESGTPSDAIPCSSAHTTAVSRCGSKQDVAIPIAEIILMVSDDKLFLLMWFEWLPCSNSPSSQTR